MMVRVDRDFKSNLFGYDYCSRELWLNLLILIPSSHSLDQKYNGGLP